MKKVLYLSYALPWVLSAVATGDAHAQEEPSSQEEANQAEQRAQAAEDALRQALSDIENLRGRLEQLEQEADDRRQRAEAAELEELRRAAEDAASAPETAEERAAELSSDQVFTSGQRSLQALNPELSVVVDSGLQLQMNDGEPSSLFGSTEHHDEGHDHEHSHSTGSGSGFFFRHMGIHFETNLDPFSFTKIAVGVDTSGVHLGEAYITWVRVASGLRLSGRR